ncbi:MAG: hypothetical protein GC131_06700 [Alphaproteobacteria bacterium]|nr:hypothetical protein [Alphaproteobacteria bacterium]
MDMAVKKTTKMARAKIGAGGSDDIRKGFLNPPDDLKQLKIISAQAVRTLSEDINRIKRGELRGKKLAIVLATGGTLAMRTEAGIRTPHLDFQQLFTHMGGNLAERFEIRGLQAFNIDSSQMDYRHTRELAIVMTWLWGAIKVPFTGFLVTHGTDTMSYAAAATSLMMGPGMPFSVVYTGAQRPMEDPLSDVQINIRNSLYTLESLHAKNMAEVLIVMGDRAVLATSSEKVNDTLANAFDAPRHHYVARYNRMDHPVPLADWLKPRRRAPFKPTIWQGDHSHTLVVKSTLGLDPKMVTHQIEQPSVRSVILYSFGAGTVHEDIIAATVEPAKRRGIPVFVVNPVHADYRVEYLSSFKAVRMGATPLDMTLSSALAKTEIALRLHGGDAKAMARFMTQNYVGEVPTQLSRFVPSK